MERLKLSSTVSPGPPEAGGGTVIDQVYESVATFPAASVALTVKVCEPGGRDVYVCVVALVHGEGTEPSIVHWVSATASLAEKLKLADVWIVPLAGFDAGAIVTAIGLGSSAMIATVPVSVGPPGSNGYGGKVGDVSVERNGETATTYRPLGSTSSPGTRLRTALLL